MQCSRQIQTLSFSLLSRKWRICLPLANKHMALNVVSTSAEEDKSVSHVQDYDVPGNAVDRPGTK